MYIGSIDMSEENQSFDINAIISNENTVISNEVPVIEENNTTNDNEENNTTNDNEENNTTNDNEDNSLIRSIKTHTSKTNGSVHSTNNSVEDVPQSELSNNSNDENDSDGEDSSIVSGIVIPARGKVPNGKTEWFKQPQYIIFINELKNIKKSNLIVLKECKESKRLLDLKFSDLTNIINRIQTSVIFLSTVSGFFNATKVQFGLSESIISVMSITISTYVTLVLSVSKYFKYDESKEGIQSLRDKFSLLHNQIEHRMDIIGPWNDPNLWIYSDPDVKLREWDEIKATMKKEYDSIIINKQKLTTEFEIIMDTKSRNAYHINNKQLTYDNRIKLFGWEKKEMDLKEVIEKEYDKRKEKKWARKKKIMETASQYNIENVKIRRHNLVSNHEIMEDNWDDNDSDESTLV